MLTADLVRTRVRRGQLQPQWIDARAEENLSLAATIIEIVARHRGRPRRELEAELREFLGTGTSFLFHRGLAKLLQDRCTFETHAPIDPPLVREAVFRRAAEAYQDLSTLQPRTEDILAAAADELGIEAPGDSLYADLKTEQILEEFKDCTPEWLLDRYNVALVQALLLRASGLDIEIEGETPARYREIFRRIKFFRLLHEIEPAAGNKFRIRLDGPLSLFKSSQRYGLQMAQFFPVLLHCESWRLTARLVWTKGRGETEFALDSSRKLHPISPIQGQWRPEEIDWFETQFAKLKTEWQLSLDTELITLGGRGVLSPDFVFTHPSGTRIVMEVMGFWRRGSLESRLRLLRDHGPKNFILAVSRDLHVDEEEAELPGELYVFRTTPVARDVLKLLERMRV